MAIALLWLKEDLMDEFKEGEDFKVVSDQSIRDGHSKYDGILFNVFAAYCFGRKASEISEMYGIPTATFYYLKQKHHWEEKKKEFMELVNQRVMYDMVQTKADLVKMANAIAQAAGAYILNKVKDNTMKFSVRDFSSAVKAFMCLTGDTDIEGQKKGFFSKELLEEIAQDLTPDERGILLEVTRKIQEKLKKDKQEKILHLI